MRYSRKDILLYGVTDSQWLEGRSLYEVVKEALDGGATTIQLREKSISDQEFLALAQQIIPLCKSYKVPLIINDNVNVAAACDCEGVHVGQGDMCLKEVRKLLGDNKIIGVSTHSVEEAITAQSDGADYIGVGAVFSTSTKGDANSVSKELLSEICSSVQIPVCAIGGISASNIQELKSTGIDGVAVVSAIFAAKDIKLVTEDMLAKVKSVVVPKDYDGIIFDMDGTFIDSMAHWDNLPTSVLNKRGLTPKEDINKIFKNLSMTQAAQYYIDNYGFTESVEEIIAQVVGQIKDFYKYDAPCREGAVELFTSCKEKNIAMCVATATDRPLADIVLKRLDLQQYFSHVFTCKEVGAGKDKPTIYEKALEALGTAKDRTLVFEDALYAVKTAKEAGFTVVAIYDETASKDWDKIIKIADYNIKSLTDILQ